MVNGWGRRMDGRTDEWKEGWTSGNSPLCSTEHRPFGAAAQKGVGTYRMGGHSRGKKGDAPI